MQIEQLELNPSLSCHNSPLSSTLLAVTSNLSYCEVPALTWCSPSRQGLTVAYNLLASACFGVQVTSTDGQNQLSGKLVLVRAAQNWGVETLFVYASRHRLDSFGSGKTHNESCYLPWPKLLKGTFDTGHGTLHPYSTPPKNSHFSRRHQFRYQIRAPVDLKMDFRADVRWITLVPNKKDHLFDERVL